MLFSPYLSDEEKALLAKCITRTIRRYRSKQKNGSTVESRNTTIGRPRVIISEIINSLCAKLTEHSTMYQDEMVLFLREQFGIYVTRSAISRALTFAGWSNKVTRRVAQQRNADLRDYYLHKTSPFRYYHRIYVDESGMSGPDTSQRNGWSPKGTAPV